MILELTEAPTRLFVNAKGKIVSLSASGGFYAGPDDDDKKDEDEVEENDHTGPIQIGGGPTEEGTDYIPNIPDPATGNGQF